ncbi:MAG: hypothetical protein WA227_24555, partial [Mycobacterium sp.]
VIRYAAALGEEFGGRLTLDLWVLNLPKPERVTTPLLVLGVNRPGMSGDSTSWEGWSHVSEYVEEVSAGAA